MRHPLRRAVEIGWEDGPAPQWAGFVGIAEAPAEGGMGTAACQNMLPVR